MGLFGFGTKPKPIEIEASALSATDIQQGRYEGQVVTLKGRVCEQGAIMELSTGFRFMDCSVLVDVLDMSGMTSLFVKKFVRGEYNGQARATGVIEIERRSRTPSYRLIVEDKSHLSFSV